MIKSGSQQTGYLLKGLMKKAPYHAAVADVVSRHP